MNIKITDLQINPRIVTATKRAGLHDGAAVLNFSSAELERLTGLTASDVTQLKDAVSHSVSTDQSVTALSMWRQKCSQDASAGKLSTGCKKLDRALRGGLLLHGITEIVGESASGKTQLCLQLCLSVQLPMEKGGLNGDAIYICTEGAFPNRRLEQMSRHFSNQYASVAEHRFTDHILLEHVADFAGFEQCLVRKLPLALARGRIKLVVVDSVAALFRCHYDSHSLVARGKHLASLAVTLRRLSDQYGVVIVCVNQVSANMGKGSKSGGALRQSIPALGLVWADHVTCRLLLSRRDHHFALSGRAGEGRDKDCGVVSKKQLEVVFAPHLAPVVVPLAVSQSGIAVDNETCSPVACPASMPLVTALVSYIPRERLQSLLDGLPPEDDSALLLDHFDGVQ